MSISRGPITERELDRHVDALLRGGDARGAAEGPSPLVAARTSAMIRTMTAGDVDHAGAADTPWIVRTIRATTFAQRIAATVIIAVGAAAIAATLTIMRSTSSSAVTYANVAGHFRSAQTLAF